MAARIDDVRAIDDVDYVDDARSRIIDTARRAQLLESQTDILHCLLNVNLLMARNLNYRRVQVVLVLLLLIDEAARERFSGRDRRVRHDG